MNFSDQWRSLWTVAAVPHAPNLISGDKAAGLGPLLFHPSPLRHMLLTSCSLALYIPPPSPPILSGIQSFFRCPTNGSFLPTADQYDLATDIQSSLASASNNFLDPLSRNNLHALKCHDGFSLLLFFPTGDNGDEIGFLCLQFRDESLKPEVGVDLGGDIFKQREGLKYPRHRILKLSIVSSQVDSSLPTDSSITEGFLMASTLYSVNWFRIETQSTDQGMLRPSLIPLAKQGFSKCVVDICWSPHFLEESVVLLETGELYWFNLINKRGGTHKISLGDNANPRRWLRCKFGGQPWVVLIASSIAVILIDLRPKKINEVPKVLARVSLPDFLGVISLEAEKDAFQAFCRASFNDFHFTVVTENKLLLFDIRQPLVPVLTWNHSLKHPTYLSMFRLSELRPSEEFKWASESGFVILVGSFWKNDFRLFCYGSSDKGAFGSSFFAWEHSASLFLSGKRWSFDDIIREMMLKEKRLNQEMLLRNERVSGFFIIPRNNLLKCRPKSSGFILIRLMLSGKLEIQEYHSSYGSQNDDFMCQGADLNEMEDFILYNTHEGNKVSSQFYFLKLCYLSKYMNGSLSNMLIKSYLELNEKGMKPKSCSGDLSELLSSKLHSSSISTSSLIADVSMPTSVFEVALRRVLTTLQPKFLSLAFAKFEELFTGHVETSFLPLELPRCLPCHKFPPFLMNIPSRRSELLPNKVLSGDAIVGPILPLAVLLVLQQKGFGTTNFSDVEELDGDLLNLECKGVFKSLFPEVSITDSYGFNGLGFSQDRQDDKQVFVYQPTLKSCRSIFNDNNIIVPNEEAQSQMNHLSENHLFTEDTLNEEKFTTFICGNFDKNCHSNFGSEVTNPQIFDVGSVKLDFESSDIMMQPIEQNFLKSLKRQASKWLENNKSYQEFCNSKIQRHCCDL